MKISKFELRDYQKRAVSEGATALLNHQTRGHYPIIQAGTGAGKSLIIAGIVNKLLATLPKPKRESECQIVILQPNKELLEQNSDKLAWYGIDNIAVMSASLNRKEAGRVTMATIGTIKSHSPVFQHVKYVLIDECFVAGTKVDGKNIEDIKVGDCVSSYNHVTGKIENKRVRRVIKKPSPNKLYCISTQSGTIISTGNHEYFTQRGYVRADNIVEGDVVYEASLHDKEIWNRKNLPNMQENSQAKGHEPVSKKRAVCRVKGKNVVLQQSVRENIRGKKDARPADVATRAWIFKEGERERSCHKEAKRNRQADMGKGCDKSLPQRRERKTTNHLAEDSTRETWSGLDDRTTNSNARTEGERQVSNMLQSGFRQPMANAGNRAGRRKPQGLGSKEERCQEDCQIKPIRVDSIAVLEQGSYEKLGLSDGGNYVYCITVEGNHNFFANGILVHNCDCVAITSSSQYVKWLQEVGYPPVLGLTATPYKLRSETLREHGQVFVQSAISLLNRFPPIKFNHKNTFFWGKIIYHYELADLMRDKYLAPIKYYSEIPEATLRLNSTGADYIMDDIETFAVNSWNRILHVVIGALTKHPSRILVFCPSVKSAEIICEELQARKVQAEWVCGATSKKERTDKINRFKSGECKVMLNCMCLTAGFDLPELDCIIYARPTLSPRVWIQAIGRGVRLDSSNPDKVLTVYDLVGLCSTIGPVEQIRLRLDSRPNELWSRRGRIDNRSLSKFALKPKLIAPPVLNTPLDATGSRITSDSVKVV